MALVVKDRVQETSNTTGTGTFTLGGAVTGFQSFSAIGNGNTTYYAIVGGSQWEVGIGTYVSSGTTLSRDTVLASSTGSKIDFAAGSKNVFCTYPADKAIYDDASGNAIDLGTPSSVTLTNATGLPLTTGVSGTLPTANGGTNLTTYVTGDILYASSTNTLSKLTIGTNGYVLTSNGTTPQWSDIPDQPVISSVSPTSFGGASGTSFTITGVGFASGAVVTFVGNDNTLYTAATTTFTNTTSLTATTPSAFPISNSPYGVTVTLASGATTTRTAQITAGTAPSWTTASGTLGSYSETASISTSVVATDPDGGAITYSVVSGALPSGVSLNTSTGAITGTAPSVTVDTTYSFTIRATDVGSNTTDRAFSITVLDNIAPVWTTPAGSLGNVYDASRTGASFTVAATDAQTVSYSLVSGSYPGGMSLNSSTGVISGNVTSVGTDTTYNFTLAASDGSLSTNRAFSITVYAPAALLYTSGSGTFTTSQGQKNFTVTISGGGGGGSTTSCGGQRYAAGGGGGASQKAYSSIASGTAYSYSVGGGGTGFNYGGQCEPPGGNTGGTSSFGVMSAAGGGGGKSGVPGSGYTVVGGSGGAGSGGDTNQTGGTGGTGTTGGNGAACALATAVGSYGGGGSGNGGSGQGGFVRIVY